MQMKGRGWAMDAASELPIKQQLIEKCNRLRKRPKRPRHTRATANRHNAPAKQPGSRKGQASASHKQHNRLNGHPHSRLAEQPGSQKNQTSAPSPHRRLDIPPHSRLGAPGECACLARGEQCLPGRNNTRRARCPACPTKATRHGPPSRVAQVRVLDAWPHVRAV